jgi:hypothetical protein
VHGGTIGGMPTNPDVDAWFARYDNPQKELVQGNIASFFPKATKHVSLMFHTGVSLPDPDGILEGDGDVSRVVKIADAADLAAKTDSLRALVRAWIASRP